MHIISVKPQSQLHVNSTTHCSYYEPIHNVVGPGVRKTARINIVAVTEKELILKNISVDLDFSIECFSIDLGEVSQQYFLYEYLDQGQS